MRLTGRQTCASFLATISVAVLPSAPPTYPMNTITYATAMANSDAIHVIQIILLKLALQPVTICTTLVVNIIIVISRLMTPAKTQKDLKCAVHVKLKNRNTQVRLPGPLVYLIPKSNLVKNVIKLNIIANSDQNPISRWSILLLAQLLASPIPSKPMTIMIPAMSRLNAQAPQNSFLLYDYLLNFNTSSAIKLNMRSAMEMGWPADDTKLEQLTESNLVNSWATNVWRASCRNLRWPLNVRMTG